MDNPTNSKSAQCAKGANLIASGGVSPGNSRFSSARGSWSPFDGWDRFCGIDRYAEETDPQEWSGRVSHYLKDDGPKGLNAIADQLDRRRDGGQKPSSGWDDPLLNCRLGAPLGTHAMGSRESGICATPSAFLREMSLLLRTLGEALDAEGRSSVRLDAKRRRRGKPRKDCSAEASLEEAGIFKDLEESRKAFGGKLEAAVADVASKRKISRSKIFRVYRKARRSLAIKWLQHQRYPKLQRLSATELSRATSLTYSTN
jgi:hypothetical protein